MHPCLRLLIIILKSLLWFVKMCYYIINKYWNILKLLVFLGIVATIIYFFTYGMLYTAMPFYILDTLHLRQIFLPNILCNNCTYFPIKYLIHNETDCDPEEEIFLLTIVLSYHVHAVSRKTLRKTWAGVREYRGYRIKTIFAFGVHSDPNMEKMLLYEENLYHDLLQGDFKEDYLNLTWKSVMALTWATTYCKQAKFILKTDDDSFNHPHRIVDYLLKVRNEKFVGGYCFTVTPDRRVSSKYHVDYTLYPDVYYPTYCAGPGYILSQSAARAILDIYNNVTYIPMEDVFIAGLVRVAAGLQYTEIPGMIVDGKELTECGLATWVKNSHNVWTQQMEIYWNRALAADANIHCSQKNARITAVTFIGLLLWIRILVHIL